MRLAQSCFSRLFVAINAHLFDENVDFAKLPAAYRMQVDVPIGVGALE
jgi:hypothetical protein